MAYINPSTYPSSFGRAVRLYYEERNVNTAANTSDIYWELQGYNKTEDTTGWYYAGPFNVTINGTKVVNNLYPSGSRIQLRSDTVVAKGTLANVAHNSDGSMSVEASFSCDYINDASNKASGSGTITLTTIPRASTVTAQDGVFGQPWTYTVNNPAAFYTRVTLTIGSHTYTHTYASGLVPIANFTAAQTRAWADSCPDSDSATMTIRVETMRDEPTQGVPVEIIGDTTQTITFTVPTSWAPNFPVPTRAGGVNTYNGLTLQNLSSAQIRILATATTGASLTSIKITGPGINQTVDNPSTLTTVTTGLLTQSGDLTWTITATDSRGRQGTWKSQPLTVTRYRLPTGTLTVHRCDANGTANDLGGYMTATLKATIDTSISGNEGTAEVKLGSTSIGSTSGETAAFTLTTSQSAASTTSTYTISATVTDSAGGSVTITTRLSTAQVLMDFKAGGDGVAFGGSATRSQAIEFKNWAVCANNHRQYPGVQFKGTDQGSIGGWVWLSTKLIGSLYAGARMALSEYSYDSSTGEQLSTYETYRLPEVDPDLAASVNYEILTEKTAATAGTWNPTINWSDGTTLTTSGVVAKYQKFGKMIHYFGYFNITNLGSAGNKYLRITLPHTVLPGENGAGPRLEAATPPANSLLIRVLSTYLQVVYGPGAGYSRPQMSTGWHSFDFWAMEA